MAKGTIALGQFRGKVGGQVLRVVDGKQVIQIYQPEVRNPDTLPQQLQRAAMRTLGKLSRSFLSTIKVGFGGVYPASEFVKANISRNSGALEIGSPSDVTINYSSLKLTNGAAEGLIVVRSGIPTWGSSQHLTVSLPITEVDTADGVDRDNIRIRLVVYVPERGMSFLGPATTIEGTSVSVNVPSSVDGMDAHAWVFATLAENSADGDAYDQETLRLPSISTSAEYVGTGEIE